MTADTTSPWADACDCHMHVFDPAFPMLPSVKVLPPPFLATDYQAVQQALGIGRVIVVQPNGYGYDNSCTLAAMASLGPGARGVVTVPVDVPDAELARLHDAGIRGVRFMMLPSGMLSWDALEPLAARLAPLGWTANVQFDGRTLPQHEAVLRGLPCRVVIDHIGKFLGPVTVQDEAFQSLCRVLDGGQAWIKLSAPYESSQTGAPGYDDIAALATTLAERYPERCLWASNWPHPGIQPTPSNPALLAWALDCMGSDERRRRILVDNPAALYRF